MIDEPIAMNMELNNWLAASLVPERKRTDGDLTRLAGMIRKDREGAIRAHRQLKAAHNELVEAVNILGEKLAEAAEACATYRTAIKTLQTEVAALKKTKRGFWK